MAGHERHAGREAAVGDRNARICRRRNARGDPGHDLEIDVSLAQRQRLLAAATEHERVAALQAHHLAPGAGALDHQRLRVLLGHRLAAALLADEQQLRVRARAVERLRAGSGGRRGSCRRARSAPARAPSAGPGRRGRRRRDDTRPARADAQARASTAISSAPRAAAPGAHAPPAARATRTPELDRVVEAAEQLVGHPLRAVGQADPGAQVQAAAARRHGVGAERRVAARAERMRHARSAVRQAEASLSRIGSRRLARAVASSARACTPSAPWPGAGTKRSRRACSRCRLLAPQPRQARPSRARSREADGVARGGRARRRRWRCRVRELAQARVDIAAQAHHLQVLGRARSCAAGARCSCPRWPLAAAASSERRRSAHPRRAARAGEPSSSRPSESSTGMSLAECTARSISPASSACSSSATQRDLSSPGAGRLAHCCARSPVVQLSVPTDASTAIARHPDPPGHEPRLGERERAAARPDAHPVLRAVREFPGGMSLWSGRPGASRGWRSWALACALDRAHLGELGPRASSAGVAVAAPRRARTARARAAGWRGRARSEKLRRRIVGSCSRRPRTARATASTRIRSRSDADSQRPGVLGKDLLDDRVAVLAQSAHGRQRLQLAEPAREAADLLLHDLLGLRHDFLARSEIARHHGLEVVDVIQASLPRCPRSASRCRAAPRCRSAIAVPARPGRGAAPSRARAPRCRRSGAARRSRTPRCRPPAAARGARRGPTTEPPKRCARLSARSACRLATKIVPTPWWASAWAVSSLVSPAPRITTWRSARPPSTSWARSTATEGTLTRVEPMPVSERTRLPVVSAAANRRLEQRAGHARLPAPPHRRA